VIDPITDVQDELSRGASYTLAVRHVIEGPLQFGVVLNVSLDFWQTLARRFQALFKFRLGFHLGFSERHLHATVRIDFAFT
jgi:hypothetical protein